MKILHSYFGRLFCYTLLLGTVLILITGLLFFTVSASSIQSDLQRQCISGAQFISNRLDELLQDCDDVIEKLAEDPLVYDYICSNTVTRYEAAHVLYLSSVNLHEGVMVHLMRVEDGEIISTGEPSPLFSARHYNPALTLFKRMCASSQTQIYTSVKGILLHADTRTILGRAIHSEDGVAGYVLAEVSRQAFESAVASFSFAFNGSVFISDGYDVVLFNTAGEESEGLGKLDAAIDYAQIWQGDSSGMLEADGICYSHLQQADYVVVAEMSSDLLDRLFNSVSHTVLPVLAIVILIGISFAFIVARSIAAPVRRLTVAMGEVERGNFQARVPVTSDDEIGRLSAAFNHMQIQIESLIHNIEEKQRRLRIAESNALSLQVNPHFLYNTLDLIKWSIKLGQTQEATQIVVQLGKLLRRLINNSEEVVTVAEELELVDAYLEIQKTRHRGKIQVYLNVDQNLYAVHIPKLVLQPLIENAIKHGLENQLSGGSLTISAQRMGPYLEFIVQDNGAGMSREKLESVKRLQPNGMYNIGLSNVHERARLYGDARCGLEIESTLGGGTTITLTLRIPDGE